MYSKQETAKIKQSFWTSFGQYMKPVPFASGEKNSWINYKTGIPHIFFRMSAEKGSASVSIELDDPSAEKRLSQFALFVHFKKMLHAPDEEWKWQEETTDANGRSISRIFETIEHVNVLNQSDWPSIISFLKRHIIALDAFWEETRYGFE